MSKYFCLPNVSASIIEQKEPWNEDIKLPEFESKAKFRQFIAFPTTKYLLYSGSEGADPTQRVTSQNPPVYLHSVTADFDARLSDEEFTEVMKRMIDLQYPCSRVSRSFSKGIHATWEFETPIMLHGSKATKRLLTRISAEIGLDKLCRGFDKPAFHNPHTYYNLGTDWKKVSDIKIPISTLHYWQYETSKGDDFDGRGTVIPLDLVYGEVKKQYPNLWPGAFQEGSRGIWFWGPGATSDWNPTACIVRKEGMQCFSADKPFYTWTEILGNDFVSQFEVGRIGKCIEQYWYDSKNYLIEDEIGSFVIAQKDEAFLDLQARHNLSNQRGRNEIISEANRALHQIQRTKRVEAAVPFVFEKNRIVNFEGKRYFNTARIAPITPAQTVGEWGVDFPTIAKWADDMFGEEQLPWELAWLSYAFKNAYNGTPQKGHCHVLVGPPNCGKTMWNIKILGALFGGHMKCSEYLVGKTDFNDHLFECGMWTVDDEAGTSGESHVQFSSKIKEFVANDTFVVNAKFKKSGRVFWRGRMSITLNNDPMSMRMLPDLDMSTRDKLMVFNCARFHGFDDAFGGKVTKELPHFAAWLMAHEIPEAMREYRFGVKAYLSPTIEGAAQADGKYSHIVELLEIFRDTQLEKGEEWCGTCSELLKHISKVSGVDILLRDVNPRKLGWGLRHMASKGVSWLRRDEAKGVYRWIIKRE
jgi:hypothetical protein